MKSPCYLSETQLQEFERLRTEDGEDKLWSALGTMVPFLDKRLCLVEEAIEVFQGTSRLASFWTNGPQACELYFLLGNDGMAALGRVENLNTQVQLPLADFQPLADELGTILITDQLRFGGSFHDILVVVHRSRKPDEPEVVLYHAEAAWDGEKLHLNAMFSDPSLEKKQWLPMKADRLPEWYLRWEIYLSEQQPIYQPPNHLKLLEQLDQELSGQIEAVLCTPAVTCAMFADELRFFHQNGEVSPLHMRDWIKAAAIRDSGKTLQILVALDDLQLVGRQGLEGRALFKQSCHEAMVAVAFCGKPDQATGWRDFLVCFVDGTLHHLRLLPENRLAEVWSRLWDQLGLPSLKSKQPYRERWKKEENPQPNDAQKMAMVRAVLDHYFEENCNEGGWQELIDWLNLDESDKLLQMVVEYILNRFHLCKDNWLQDHNKGELLLSGLLHLYKKRFRLSFQDRVDRYFRSLSFTPEPPSENLEKLRWHANRNRDYVWETTHDFKSLEQQTLPDSTEPSPALEAALWQGKLAMERWMNSFWLADAIFVKDIKDRPLVGLIGLSGSHLVLATRTTLFLGTIGNLGDSLHRLEKVQKIKDFGQDAIMRLVRLAQNGLVLAMASGKLHFYALKGSSLVHTQTYPVGAHGAPWSLAHLDITNDQHLYVAFNEGRHSWLVFVLCQDGVWSKKTSIAFDLPKIRFLAAAWRSKGEVLLAKASTYAGVTSLVTLDTAGQVTQKRAAMETLTGVTALAFDRRLDPQHLLVSDRQGFVFCLRLDESVEGQAEVIWTFRCKGAVRSICAWQYQGRAHFVLGSDAGELVILQAQDGRRLWKKSLNYPVRRITLMDDEYLAVYQARGLISLYRPISGEDEALARVKEVNDWIEQTHPNEEDRKNKVWCFSDNQSLQVFFHRDHRKRTYSYILKYFVSKEPRGRTIAFFARLGELGDLEDLLKEAKFRELYLLAAYLPDHTRRETFLAIWRVLLSHQPDSPKGPHSEAAQVAAFSVILQRFQTYEWSLEQIKNLRMPVTMVKQTWPCLTYARLLLKTVQVERRFGEALFQELSPILFDMPPLLIRAFIRLRPPGSEACKAFQRFERARLAFLKSLPLATEALDALRLQLKSLSAEKSICGFLYWQLSLIRLLRSVEEGQSWLELRDRFYQALAKIYLWTTGSRTSEGTVSEHFTQLIRNRLHADAPMAESDPLQARLDWCEQFLRRLNHTKDVQVSDLPWQEEIALLAEGLRKLLLRALNLEQAHLLSEVRPRLELVSLERLYTGQVEVRLRATPEGNAELKRPSFVFEVKGAEGLREPGLLRIEYERTRYPDEFPQFEVVLTGFLWPNQTRLCVLVETEAKDYPRRKTSWDFELKAHLQRQMGGLELSQQLPAAYRGFLENLPSKQGVWVAVVDDPELQRRLAQDWAHQHRGLVVDLDKLLGDCGPGGQYAVEETSSDFVRDRLRNHLREAFNTHGLPPEGTPVCLAPFVEVGLRWLTHRGRDLLRNLLGYFLIGTVRRERSWLLLLSGQIWRASGELFDREHVLFPYALARQLMLDKPASEASQQYEALLKLVLGKDKQNFAAVSRVLNHDYRLAFLWSAWFQKTDARKRGVAAFLDSPEAIRFLKDELVSLSVEEIMTLILGSISTSQIQMKQFREGMYIAEERYSRLADGKQGKRLQIVGDRLSEHDIQILRSAGGESEIKIEGFGEGSLSPELDQLHNLLTMLLGERAKSAYRGLHRLGMVVYSGQWLRTLSPYYEYFNKLYQRFRKESDPLGCIYREVLGRGRFILENVDFARLERLLAVNYRLGQATAADVARLRQLRPLWQSGYVGDPTKRLCHELNLRSWSDEGSAFQGLEKLGLPVLLSGFSGEPGSFWFWLGEGAQVDLSLLFETCQLALAEYLTSFEKHEKKHKDGVLPDKAAARPKTVPRILMLGPGTEQMLPDGERRVAVIRQAHFLKSLYDGDLLKGLVGCVSSQLRLVALSPFQLSGPLPPGSHLFKGRSSELGYIKNHIREISTLIVGSRRVGKTSFLNQLLHWARQQPDVCPVYMDLQNASSADHFREALKQVMLNPRNSHLLNLLAGQAQPVSDLDEFVQRFHSQGLLPVFLLNEVDRLVENAPAVIEAWRKLHEERQARFIMVGYVSLLRLGDTDSPLNHFTQGTSVGLKAITLTALTPASAAEILDLLESSELGLTWVSAEEKRRAYLLCQKRSFCIPWVVQQMGHHLLESLERRREDQLSYDLVVDTLDQVGDVVWNYISAINYHHMGLTRRPADEHGYKIILYGIVRKKYLMGNTPAIKDPELSNREPLLSFGFTTVEAQGILADLMGELLLGREFTALDRWLKDLQLADVLNMMTLTLILEPDPATASRYAFLMHILPMELVRQYPHDPTLDNLILEEAKVFMRLISITELDHD